MRTQKERLSSSGDTMNPPDRGNVVRTESQGTHAGFKWVVSIMPIGHRCGYVLLPPGHPWYNKGYDNIDVSIHGGLTFSRNVGDGEGWPEAGYWIGFDCNHYDDAPDLDEMSSEFLAEYRRMEKLIQKAREVYRSLGLLATPPKRVVRRRVYVEGQCKQLASACHDVLVGADWR